MNRSASSSEPSASRLAPRIPGHDGDDVAGRWRPRARRELGRHAIQQQPALGASRRRVQKSAELRFGLQRLAVIGTVALERHCERFAIMPLGFCHVAERRARCGDARRAARSGTPTSRHRVAAPRPAFRGKALPPPRTRRATSAPGRPPAARAAPSTCRDCACERTRPPRRRSGARPRSTCSCWPAHTA